jgi:hypothetical protein
MTGPPAGSSGGPRYGRCPVGQRDGDDLSMGGPFRANVGSRGTRSTAADRRSAQGALSAAGSVHSGAAPRGLLWRGGGGSPAILSAAMRSVSRSACAGSRHPMAPPLTS